MQIPEVITLTRDDALAYQDLCDEGQEDYCNWAIRGFTIQGWLTVESIITTVVSEYLECRVNYDSLTGTVQDRQEVMDRAWDDLKEQLR